MEQDTRFWMYGPDGQHQIFNHSSEVPDGWEDHPSKVKNGAAPVAHPGYDEPQDSRIGLAQPDGVGRLTLENTGKKAAQKTRNLSDEIKPVTDPESPSKTQLPPIEEISKQDIVTQLTAKNVQFNSGWNKEKLYDLLKDAQ